jgi:hypothetical protein
VKRSLSSWGGVYEQGVLENELIRGATLQIKENVERIYEAIKTQKCSLGRRVRGEEFARCRRRSENATRMDLERNAVRVR